MLSQTWSVLRGGRQKRMLDISNKSNVAWTDVFYWDYIGISGIIRYFSAQTNVHDQHFSSQDPSDSLLTAGNTSAHHG